MGLQNLLDENGFEGKELPFVLERAEIGSGDK